MRQVEMAHERVGDDSGELVLVVCHLCRHRPRHARQLLLLQPVLLDLLSLCLTLLRLQHRCI